MSQQPMLNPELAKKYDGVADAYNDERVDLHEATRRDLGVEGLRQAVHDSYMAQPESAPIAESTYTAAAPEMTLDAHRSTVEYHEFDAVELAKSISANLALARSTVPVDHGFSKKDLGLTA